MNKKYLKKSYIQESINLYLTRGVLSLLKKRFTPKKNKILIKSCDGIGDILVRSKLMSLIENKYGKENVYVLMKDNYMPLGDFLGYNTISYSRKDRKNFLSRLKKMYILNKMGFSKYINLEFSNDITVGNLFIPERIGMIDENWQVKRNNRYYTKGFKLSGDYILTQVAVIGREALNREIDEKELIPDLRELFKIEEESVVVAVGSTERSRVCSPILMAKFLEAVIEKYPDKDIILVGNGELQYRYAERLKEIMKSDKLKNLVNKTSLKEVFELVAKSSLFIGFESGLYNLCFTLKKKGIILFSVKENPFYHNVSYLKILTPKIVREDIIDKEYPAYKINSINENDFRKALEEVKNEEKFSD